MNGNIETDSQEFDEWSMTYDMGDLPLSSKLTITAFSDVGIPSEPFVITPLITECPEWFVAMNSMGCPIIDVSTPQKFDNIWQMWYSIRIPEPKIDVVKNVPLPVIGGDFGMAVSSLFGYKIRSDAILKLFGGGEADVKIADHGGVIEVLLQGLFKVLDDPPKLKLDGAEIRIDGKILLPIPSLVWDLTIIKVKVRLVPELKVILGILEDPTGGIIDGLGWESAKGTFYTALEGYTKLEKGIGFTEVTIGGKPGLKFKVPPPYYDGVVFQVYFKLKEVFLGFSRAWDIKYEWCDPSCGSSFSNLKLITSNQKNSEWKPISRDYATLNYAKFTGSKANLEEIGPRTLVLNALGAQENPIVENILPYASPSIATDNGGNAIMVWTHDDINKPQIQGFEIYYSTWDGNSWSTPGAVSDNYLPEFKPSVLFDSNGDAIATWTLLNNASITANTSVFSVLSDVELAYSVWDKTTEVWSTPEILTNNSMFEGLASLSNDINGNVAATWIVDKDNNMTTIFDRDILYSIWNGTDWSELKAVTTDVAVDIKPALAYSQNKAISAWSQDTDNNVTTNMDRELYYAVWNGSQWSNPTYLTNDTTDDTAPKIMFDKFNKITLAWTKRNETVDRVYLSTFDNGWSSPELVAESAMIYEMGLTFDSDNNAAVVWQGASHIGQDIIYTVRDDSNHLWSGEKLLTNDTSAEWQLSATINSKDELMVSYVKQDLFIVNYTVTDGESDLYYLIHPIMLDLTLDSKDIIFSDETAYPGDTITINATIHNIGDLKANLVEVNFSDGLSGPQIGTTQTIPSLPAGQNATVSMRVRIRC